MSALGQKRTLLSRKRFRRRASIGVYIRNSGFYSTLPPYCSGTIASPRSTRGASRGVLKCGSGAVVATGCNTHARVATAEAARSRRAVTRVAGGSWRHVVPAAPTAQAFEAPAAVVRLRDSEA